MISTLSGPHLADAKPTPASPIAPVAPEREAPVASSDSSTRVTLGQRTTQYSSLTYAPAETQAVPQNSANDSASATILSFIDAQIRRDIAAGSSAEELASRLQAGLDGFLTGYNDAYQQLDASGLLTEEVSAVIKRSYDLVLEGIEALAEELGLPSPVVHSPEPVVELTSLPIEVDYAADAISLSPLKSMIDHSLRSEQHSELTLIESLSDVLLPQKERQFGSILLADQRRYQLDLYTQEGDRVSINAFSYYASTSVAAETGLSASLEQGKGLGLHIDGDINADELTAINALLSQLNDLAKDFFDGDLSAAVERAHELDIDAQQIAGLSLNLFQSQSVSRAYKEVESLAHEDPSPVLAKVEMLTLARAYQQMQELKLLADSLGFESKVIEQLTSFVADFYQNRAEESGRDSATLVDFFSKALFD